MENDDYDSADVCQELPDHLIYDIFLNLPASTLMRFRTLSKEWCKIISAPAVVKHHFLIHNYNNASSRRPKDIFIHFLCSKENEFLQFTITANMIASWSEDARNNRPTASISLPRPVSLPIPIDIGGTYVDISPSSCHGMLCLKLVHSNTYNGSIFVWNPVTCQLRHVPCPEGHHLSSFIGFGYDDVIDDYKIVLTRSAGRPRIMSLKSGYCIWRTIDTPSWGMRFSTPVTFGGDIYWISYIKRKDIIKENYWASQNLSEIWYYVVLKFNVTNESLTVLPSPFEGEPSNHKKMELRQYCGSLCFFIIDSGISCNGHWANIWTLRQDKNGEPVWNSVMDVPYSPFLQYHGRHCKFEFTTSGDLIICAAGYGLLVYLSQEKRYLEVPLNDHHPMHDRLMLAKGFYFFQNESLVSPFCSEQ